HERNPRAHVVGVTAGRIDARLLFDTAPPGDHDELPIRELLAAAAHPTGEGGDIAATGHPSHEPHDHADAEAVTVQSDGAVDAGRVVDLLEAPGAGVYRLKGTVHVRSGRRTRSFVVNV